MKPRISVDFNNADAAGRVRLNTKAALADIARLGVHLQDGMVVELADDNLQTDGEVAFSPEERLWVAMIDWGAIRDTTPFDEGR